MLTKPPVSTPVKVPGGVSTLLPAALVKGEVDEAMNALKSLFFEHGFFNEK